MAEKSKPTLHLIGLLPDPQWLPPAVLTLIEEADVLAASDRLLSLFPRAKAARLRMSMPLEGWLKELKSLQRKGKKVAVLTSGDPNHYGLAKKLLSVIEPESVTVIPAPTIVQEAFARLKTSWAHTEVVSLTAANPRPLSGAPSSGPATIPARASWPSTPTRTTPRRSSPSASWAGASATGA